MIVIVVVIITIIVVISYIYSWCITVFCIIFIATITIS